MAHFKQYSEANYKRMFFFNIAIGQQFRKDFFASGRRRNDVACIKTSNTTYKEVFTGTEHTISTDQFEVSSYN